MGLPRWQGPILLDRCLDAASEVDVPDPGRDAVVTRVVLVGVRHSTRQRESVLGPDIGIDVAVRKARVLDEPVADVKASCEEVVESAFYPNARLARAAVR